MKPILTLVGLGLCGALNFVALPAHATLEVGASVEISARADFEVPLAAQGTWVEVGSYGRCWHPTGVAVGWRPYCDGSWVWTDCGWYWQSDEPFAWACYHYGRWDYSPAFGWYWIPDIEWAPSWVYWRYGGGYVGWAPCPPRGVVIASSSFAFVEVGHFHERVHPRTVVINNTTIINKTKEITVIKHETRNINGSSRRVVVNDGPGVEPIRNATHQDVKAVPIQEAARRSPPPASVDRRPNQRQNSPNGQPADRNQTDGPKDRNQPDQNRNQRDRNQTDNPEAGAPHPQPAERPVHPNPPPDDNPNNLFRNNPRNNPPQNNPAPNNPPPHNPTPNNPPPPIAPSPNNRPPETHQAPNDQRTPRPRGNRRPPVREPAPAPAPAPAPPPENRGENHDNHDKDHPDHP